MVARNLSSRAGDQPKAVALGALRNEKVATALSRAGHVASSPTMSSAMQERFFALDQPTSLVALKGLSHGVFGEEGALFTSVSEAIKIVGLPLFRSAYLASSVALSLNHWLGPNSVLAREIFRHALCSSAIIAVLAETRPQGQEWPHLALVNRLGIACMATTIPQAYSPGSALASGAYRSIEEMERTEFGFDHHAVTAHLLEATKFPSAFWSTGQNAGDGGLALALGDHLAQEMGCTFGYSLAIGNFESEAFAELELADSEMAKIATSANRAASAVDRFALLG